MALDFQIEPFFDDYSEDNKFYRILFRPSYAVQARELTQLQTILQEQIRRHGDHIFKEGSMVIPGQISYDLDVYYVKLVTSAGVNAALVLNSLVGKEIKNSQNLTAKVIKYSVAEGSDPDTIYVKYLNSVQSLGANVRQFSPGDVLIPVDGTAGLTVTVADVVGLEAPVGKSSIASIQRGVYYIKKNFVLVTEQSIILDKYNNSPSYRVGLQLEEDIVYPEQDESLLDNALGSPNYAAPGAARYYIDLVLTKLSLNSTTDDEFIELLRLKEGKVLFKIDRSQYAELEKTLARRTYDESGDYSLYPFGIQVRQYRNNLRGEWAAGEKYIQGDIIRVSAGLGFNYFVAVTNGISGSLTPSWSTSAASINDNTIIWEYAIVPKFNQGIYSFPSGDSNYSSFTINDHIRLDGMLAIGVEPSKAYVRGYEIEKLTTEYLPVEKCRDLPLGSSALASYLGVDSLPASTAAVSQAKTANIDVSMGSYIIVDSVLFSPVLTTLTTVNLHNVVRASAGAGTIIGQARVRGIELHSGTQYKVFLFDIIMKPGNTISDVKSIWNNSTSFMANAVQSGTPAVTVLYNPERSSLIYQLPDYAIRNISEVTYSVMTSFTQNSNASGVISSISPPSGYSFESIYDPQNYIVIKNTTGDYVASPTLALSAGLLSVSGLTASTSYTIIATVKRSDATNALSLVEVTDYTDNFTTSTEATSYKLVLDKGYAIRIASVMMDSRGFNVGGSPIYDTNITSRYTFNNGQTNSSFYFSEINLIPGAPPPTGSIQVNYEYLDITTNTPGDFIGVNSYTHASSEMRYDQIGAFGRQQLRDCIDFRPFVDGANFATKYFPKFGTTASIKYTHYLPRIDNISLGIDGKYLVSSGIPSLSATEPSIPNDSMKLARLSLEPYTFSTTERSLAIDRVENKRYTMRDIGKLERRIEDLEYYTSLNLLELETKNMKIIDSSGLDRLQNGFIVDTFDGQGIGNAVSSEWNASIDSARKELRPFFSQKQVNLLENVLASEKNYKVSGDLVTLPYTEVALITQNRASKTENVNPYALYTWNGIVTLNPWSDTWFSTERRPDIILNDEGQYNALVAKAEAEGVLGTVWNSWQTVFSSARSLGTRLEKLAAWSTANNEILNDTNNGGTFWRNRGTFTNEELNAIGVTDGDIYGASAQAAAGTRVLTIETQAIETTASRSGVRTFVVDKVDSRVLEDRVVETRVVPYIRPRAVLFTGFGFKPLTRLYSFFDGVNVDSYITPATRISFTRILKPNSTTAYYPHLFDVERNAGSAVQNAERLVTNNGTEDVEIAFNHGEVLKEYVGGVATGRSAIVVGQEVVGSTYYIYVLNIKGGTGFSTASNAYLEGEYLVSGDKPRIKFTNLTTNTTLISSATGIINGIYRIPNNPIDKFRTGVRELKFTDSPSNNEADKSTTGSSFYEANGLIEVKQRTIVSTRTAQLVSTQVSETNTVVTTNDRLTRDTGWFDPLAQTFLVQQDGGAFITSVDLYFSTVDLNVPVRVELREVVNGYPGSRVLPFSRVELKGSGITTSANGSVATKFRFTSPVYLQNGIEYALVVLSDSNNYRIWISETDTIDVLTGNRISSQPYNGVLFKSQNASAWTADQTQDMKFVLYRANFTTTPVNIEMIPPVLGYKNLDFNPFNFITFEGATWTATGSTNVVVTYNNHGLLNGEKATLVFTANSGTNATSATYTVSGVTTNTFTITNPISITGSGTAILGSAKVRVTHRDHGMIAGDKVKFISRQAISSINGIPQAEIFGVEHTIIKAETDAYVLEFPTPSNAAGQAGGSYIAATENYEYQTAMIDIAQTAVPGCSIDYTITNVNSLDAVNTYSIVPKENLTFNENKVFPSTINYTGNPLVVKAQLKTSNSAISPVIDLGRSAITLVSNKIDNPSINDNDDDLDLFGLAGGTEIGSGKPITRSGNTLIINSVSQLTLYNAFNELNPGNVIRLLYSGVIGFNYMEVVDKYYDSSGNIYIVTKPLDDTSSIVDTVVSQTVTIVWMSHYNTEVSNGNGSVTSKYVTKKINLSRPSEMLRVMFSAIIPTEADVDIYYKTGLNASGDFENLGYTKATPTTSSIKSSSEFTDVIFDIENLNAFDTFMVKLVMRSTNKAAVPRIKDLRVIACAA